MKVSIKDFKVKIEIKNKGIEVTRDEFMHWMAP